MLASLFLALAQLATAQEAPATPPASQPQVKVNMLNVCTPSAAEQKEIAGALDRIPKSPLFGSDFEVSRGRSTLSDMPNLLQPGTTTHFENEKSVASYVRIRREFSVQALFSSVQYSFSNDGQNMVETLVLHVRDPKDLIQVSIEDSASSVTSSEAMLGSNSPASRVRLERFGKSSIALARCQADGRRRAGRPERVRAAVPRRVGCAGELSCVAAREKNCARRSWRTLASGVEASQNHRNQGERDHGEAGAGELLSNDREFLWNCAGRR